MIATTIESIQDVMDLERILDGISRFRAALSAGIEQRIGPLKKRIIKLSEPYTGKFLDEAMNIGLTQLLMTWLGMTVVEHDSSVHWHSMRGWFLRERISNLTERVVNARNDDGPNHEVSLPLLALPTHAGGWLDPIVLVQRIDEHYVKTSRADRLLRSCPSHPSTDARWKGRCVGSVATSDRHAGGHYDGGSILRYALGDSCELKSFGGWGSEAALVAAVRARQDRRTGRHVRRILSPAPAIERIRASRWRER